MKNSTNRKSQQGFYSLSCAAISLAFIIDCFLFAWLAHFCYSPEYPLTLAENLTVPLPRI